MGDWVEHAKINLELVWLRCKRLVTTLGQVLSFGAILYGGYELVYRAGLSMAVGNLLPAVPYPLTNVQAFFVVFLSVSVAWVLTG